MNYKNYKKIAVKDMDCFTEGVLFGLFSTPVSYLLYKLKVNPYLMTITHFILKILSAGCFFNSNYITGVILFLIAVFIDNMDGKVARALYKKDPESRGTLDYIFDIIALCSMYFALIFSLNSYNGLLVLLGFTGVALYLALSACKFRLYCIKGIGANKPIRKVVKPNTLLKPVFWLQDKFAKIKTTFIPSMVEAEMLTFVLFPIFLNPVLLYLALGCVVIDIIGAFIPIYLILKEEKQ